MIRKLASGKYRLFAQEGSENRPAAQSRHVCEPRRRAEARTRRAIFQAALISFLSPLRGEREPPVIRHPEVAAKGAHRASAMGSRSSPRRATVEAFGPLILRGSRLYRSHGEKGGRIARMRFYLTSRRCAIL
jgi:hypothetical protein